MRQASGGNLDLDFGRTEQRNYIEKGILAGFLSNNGTFNTKHSTSDISIVYGPFATAGLVVTSSNQFLPVVAHDKWE